MPQKKTVERKSVEKTEKTTEKVMDDILYKKKKEDSSTKNNNENTTPNQETDKDNAIAGENTSNKETSKKTKQAKSAKDFVPGTKVIAIDSFAQDAIGDFPVNWVTNSSGEIVTFDDSKTKWLKLSGIGSYSPINFNKLPENFTFEFDLYSTDNFSYYSTGFNVVFIQSTTKNDYLNWGEFKVGKEGVLLGLHPKSAGGHAGRGYFKVITNGEKLMDNELETSAYTNANNTAKVQIWRQKNRLRMYVNGEKIWDLPNVFQDAQYNRIVIYLHNYHEKDDFYYISNLRLAEAGKDTRHKLIETGAFTTNEILFDTKKATIKSSSTPILNEIGKVLEENPNIKVKIIGHTDSDGTESDNLKLSQQRAESVKNYLTANFKIDKNNLITEGKGETSPIADNATEEGKKQNRRVEFLIIK